MYFLTYILAVVGALYLSRVLWKFSKRFHFGLVQHYRFHSWPDSSGLRIKSCFLARCPHGDMEVRVFTLREGESLSGRSLLDFHKPEKEGRLNGLVIVFVNKYGEKHYWLPKPRIATLFPDAARKYWWQLWRYPHANDVIEETKRWVKQKVIEINTEEDLLRREEIHFFEREIKAKEAMEKLSPATIGALSNAEATGGEVTPAQGGEVSNVIEMRPSSVEPQKK